MTAERYLSVLGWEDVKPLLRLMEIDSDASFRRQLELALRRLPMDEVAAAWVGERLGGLIPAAVPVVVPPGDRISSAAWLTSLLIELISRARDLDKEFPVFLAAFDMDRRQSLAYPFLNAVLGAVAGTAGGGADRWITALLARCSPTDVVAALTEEMVGSPSTGLPGRRQEAAEALAEAAELLGLLDPPAVPSHSPGLARILLDPELRWRTTRSSPERPLPWPGGQPMRSSRPPEDDDPHGPQLSYGPPPWSRFPRWSWPERWSWHRGRSGSRAESLSGLQPQLEESPAVTTRTAFARLNAPHAVAAGEEFPVLVGLSPKADPGVLQPSSLEVPTEEFKLGVQLMLDGFTVIGGTTTFALQVTDFDPYPYALVRLIADDRHELAAARSILAVYSVGDHPLGVATRSVYVVPRGSVLPAAQSVKLPPDEDWSMPVGENDPDVTIVVRTGDDADGKVLLWAVHSPHVAVPVPAEPLRTRIDVATGEWARRVMNGVEEHKSAVGLRTYLDGVSAVVGQAVPPQVWTVLRAAAEITALPTVLLSTAEPYIPWELARVPEPWADARPPYLGAQAVIGRWIYREQGATRSPESRVEARRIAVVRGTYGGGQRLPEAEAEAEHLRDVYGASVVPALMEKVVDCLTGMPEVEVLHFAVHGRFDPDGFQDGILMEDGEVIEPLNVRGVGKSPVRIVILNGCQLGQGQTMLGDNAGMAAAFLAIGATAVVAPLWKVDDAVARKLATGLFAALQDGRSPAEFLLEARTSAMTADGTSESTNLAYLFFGHPRLRVAGLVPRASQGGR